MPDHNPRVFADQAIRLCDLVDEAGVIADVFIKNCVVNGPVVAYWDNSNRSARCRFPQGPSAVLWQISRERPVVSGVVILRNCAFEDSVFFSVGLAVHEDDMPEWMLSLPQ